MRFTRVPRVAILANKEGSRSRAVRAQHGGQQWSEWEFGSGCSAPFIGSVRLPVKPTASRDACYRTQGRPRKELSVMLRMYHQSYQFKKLLVDATLRFHAQPRRQRKPTTTTNLRRTFPLAVPRPRRWRRVLPTVQHASNAARPSHEIDARRPPDAGTRKTATWPDRRRLFLPALGCLSHVSPAHCMEDRDCKPMR